jgi:toxin ParE1/3/4
VLPINWKPNARIDLVEILDYIADRNSSAADKLHDQITYDLQQASEHPYLFKASFRYPGAREIVTHPNYIIVYRVTSSSIEVLRLLHARRQFPIGR